MMMKSSYILSCFLLLLMLSSRPAARKLAALVQEQPLVLNYHHGTLLKGNVSLNLLWYGRFSPSQRSIILDFFHSLNSPIPPSSPSVFSWWRTTSYYKGGPSSLSVGKQVFDDNCSLGKLLKSPQIPSLAAKAGSGSRNGGGATINIILTSADVAVDGFCMNRCGTHASSPAGAGSKVRSVYAWVGNSASQCPGQCAWPFHQPIYGPQTPPLVAPNGDVGVDGMIINLATVLAGAITNPFNNGYFQGSAEAPLEAVSACTGIFGKGAYPGYPGVVLVDKTTGASYNADGINGRKYLLPAMWNPRTSTCETLA